MSDPQQAVTFQAPELEEVALLFPAYDVHCLIACGGMGAVYQATQRSLDRLTAIKILPREFSTDEEFRKGFEAEAKAMAKLNHPNLIGVYDFGEVDGMLFIIMEYVDGKSLFHSANGKAVDQEDALRIVSAVCSGLENAHSHGILHRDIKPGNILLDPSVSPKIGDFGLARALESQIQDGEQIFGTPGYTAPEVLEPPFTFDQRADVFSVGVMLHELLTGKLPDSDPLPASKLSSCSPRLDAVIRKATHPDPAQRYTTAAELGAEVDRIASAPSGPLLATGSAHVSRKTYAPPKYQPKSSSSGLLVPVLLLVGAAGAAVYFLNTKSSAPEEEVVAPEDTAPKIVVVEPIRPDKPGNDSPVPERPADTPSVNEGFDVDSFLQKARASVAGRVRPFFEKSESDLEANTEAYERELAAVVGKLDPVFLTHAEEQLALEAEKWKADGHMIPETIPEELGIVPGAPELHTAFFAKQTGILETAATGVKAQSGVYVLGLEDQIAQLDRDGDKEVIPAIREEVGRVKTEEGYFSSLFKN